MNSGFDPVVVAPGLWRTQTATQQTPFHFGGSQVPIHLGMRGSGMRPVMSIRPVRRPPGFGPVVDMNRVAGFIRK